MEEKKAKTIALSGGPILSRSKRWSVKWLWGEEQEEEEEEVAEKYADF